MCYEQYASSPDDTGSTVSAIAQVEICTVRVPLQEPLSFSTRRVVAREHALVRVRDRTTPWA